MEQSVEKFKPKGALENKEVSNDDKKLKGSPMTATGYRVNRLEVYQRKSGKETTKRSPPLVRTNLEKWPQRSGSE